MTMEEERLMILQMLSDKKITPQEAVELLKALEVDPQITAATEASAAESAPVPEGHGESTGIDEHRPTPLRPPISPAPPQAPEPIVRLRGLSSLGEMLEGLVNRLTPNLTPGIEVQEVAEGELTGDLIDIDLHSVNGALVVRAWDQPGFRAVIQRRVRAGSEEEARRRGAELAPFHAGPGSLRLHATAHYDLTQCQAELWIPAGRRYHISARTGNGRIEVTDLSGTEVRIRSGNGRLTVSGGEWDRAEMHTGNGNAQIEAAAGQMTVVTGNGSATVRPRGRRSSEVEVTTGNGSITVGTEGLYGAGLRLDISTGVGEIRCQVPNLSTTHQKDHLTGRRLEGRTEGYDQNPVQVSVRARTGVGSVTID